MEKIFFCEKDFWDENGQKFRLSYWLLLCCTKQERRYGVAVEKRSASGSCERDECCGISQERGEAERFLRKLCGATALPVELAALCDDFISERENAEESAGALAVS